MEFITTRFPDVIIIEPEIYKDHRGSFCESFNLKKFQDNVENTNFVLEFESKSKKNTLRGLHYQSLPYAQSKLVGVSYGKVLDIIVDIQKNSPTFGEHLIIELSDENNRQLYIPKGYAHGFFVLSDNATMNYKLDNYYSQDNYTGINIFDVNLNIKIPVERKDILISEKDMALPLFNQAIYFNK